MGKRKQSPAPPPAVVESPAFWFGFEVAWAKLVAGRTILFALLAIDALLAIRHAPRYGAGGFNVAQLPFLDGLGPTRVSYAIGQLLLADLFVLAACGVATRFAVPCATAIYAWLYFGSQLDSYQHHYLVSLLLLIACFVPWQRPASATAATPVRTWALRLFLVQLGILYLWAAISKMDRAWLDGHALGMQILPQPDRLIDLRALLDGRLSITKLAKLVLMTELTLAFTVWLRPTWPVIAPIGILFHLGIVFTGLEIGLFAWIMIGVYAFVIPDRVWVGLAELPPSRIAIRMFGRLGRALEGRAGVVVGGVGCVLALVLATVSRFDHAVAVGVAMLVVAIALAAIWRRPRAIAWLGIAQVIATLAWLAVDRETTVVVDYYRFWGGSSRRLGNLGDAEAAYRRLIEVAPDDDTGHYQLGRVLLPTDSTGGLEELHAAQRVAPDRARAFVAEARWLVNQHRAAEASAKAAAALAAEPTSPEARQLVDQLAGRKTAPVPVDRDDP